MRGALDTCIVDRGQAACKKLQRAQFLQNDKKTLTCIRHRLRGLPGYS
jgi:hypothetical protein